MTHLVVLGLCVLGAVGRKLGLGASMSADEEERTGRHHQGRHHAADDDGGGNHVSLAGVEHDGRHGALRGESEGR